MTDCKKEYRDLQWQHGRKFSSSHHITHFMTCSVCLLHCICLCYCFHDFPLVYFLLLLLNRGSDYAAVLFKVSEYPFKQNKNTSKNIKVLLYTHFYNIYLIMLRPTLFNICNLPFSYFPNIREIKVNIGPKTNYLFLRYELLHCSIIARQIK